MKSTQIRNNQPAVTTQKPFFNRGGENSFFSKSVGTESSFMCSSNIQASMTVGQPDDPFEKEAENVSRQVVDGLDQSANIQQRLSSFGLQNLTIQPFNIGSRISRKLQRTFLPSPVTVQKKCPECEEEDKKQKSENVQFAGEGSAVPSAIEDQIRMAQGGGQPMDDNTQTAMESSFGADFSGVRLHTDSKAVQMSQDLNAHAFTVGNNIFFNQGRYQPQTKQGAGLLAHELTHTVQQGASVQKKQINREVLLSSLSKHTMAHLSAMNGDESSSLSSKEITQSQQFPEEEMNKVQQLQMLQMKGIDKIQKKDNAMMLRRCSTKVNKKAKLKSGPTYTPNGTVTPTSVPGGGKTAHFDMTAEFEHDTANNIYSSCGEIRQYIMWSSDADRPNNGAFDATFKANEWHEDRDGVGKRYGHRSGPYSECVVLNHFEDASATKDCINGVKYIGWDDPKDGSGAKTGWWKFRLDAIDTCNSNKVLGNDFVTVDW